MSDVLADALLGLFAQASGSLPERVAQLASLAAEFLRPDEELELLTLDGRRFTGVAVLHEGVVLALLASESRRSRRRYQPHRDYVPDWEDSYFES
ncbi:MAG TPA: hypothetical protein VLC09_03140 [Polyangiaceae bacterium]|nr:hypothetical protein [Polyangiaceae bacterium]